MKLFRIEKNTPNLELKKFKKGYYKIIVTFDGITELEVFCKIDKKTSDYFYFKVEDKDLPSFKKLEELKMGYFVIPEQSDMGVIELHPEPTIINFNNQKEESTMSNVNYNVNDLANVSETTLNHALKSLETKERIIEGVNTLPEEFLPQVEAVKATTKASDLEARVAVLAAMANFTFENATVVEEAEETVKEPVETKVEEPTEKIETNAEEVDIEEVVEETKKMSKEELDERIQATRKTIAAAQEAANAGFSFTKTTLKVAVGAAVAYGVYKLVKKFI